MHFARTFSAGKAPAAGGGASKAAAPPPGLSVSIAVPCLAASGDTLQWSLRRGVANPLDKSFLAVIVVVAVVVVLRHRIHPAIKIASDAGVVEPARQFCRKKR